VAAGENEQVQARDDQPRFVPAEAHAQYCYGVGAARKVPDARMKFLRENNARTRYLSVDECHRLIDSCMAPHIRAIVTVALHTGMRLGEILNLRWQDLDFSSGFILVRDSKNGQARQVPMDSIIEAASELASIVGPGHSLHQRPHWRSHRRYSGRILECL